MKCQNCGTNVMNGAQFCPNCGSNQLIAETSQSNYSSQHGYGHSQQGFGQAGYAQPAFQQNFQQEVSLNDAEVWMKILCFIIPIVGIIFYFVKKQKEPVYAKSCLTWGLIGFGVSFILGIIF